MTTQIFSPGSYSSVASLTLIVWDYVQTIDIEVGVIWSADWSLIKVLFLLNRYLPLIFVPLPVIYDNSQYLSPLFCKLAHRVGAVGLPTFMAISEAFMYIRTYALSHKSKQFTIFLCINALTIPIAFVSYQVHISRGEYIPTPGRSAGSCLFINHGHRYVIIAAILVVYNGVLTSALCLWFGFRHHWISTQNRLIQIMYRDGVFYLVAIALMSLLNGVILPAVNPRRQHVAAVPQAALHTILASRMILHLRNEARESLGLTTMAASCAGRGCPRDLEFNHSYAQESEWEQQLELNYNDEVETPELKTVDCRKDC